MKGVRAYIHSDGKFFTLCVDDLHGDVVIPMPPGKRDAERLAEALSIIRTAK